jgi:hypothetical protein
MLKYVPGHPEQSGIDPIAMADTQHRIHLASVPTYNDFIGRLLTAINAAGATHALATAINSNQTFLSNFMGTNDPAVIADLINQPNTRTLIMSMLNDPTMGGLDPVVLAQAMNMYPTAMAGVLGRLSPSMIAGILNTHNQLLPTLLAQLNPSVLIAGMPESDSALMSHLALTVDAKIMINVLGLGWTAVSGGGILWTLKARPSGSHRP